MTTTAVLPALDPHDFLAIDALLDDEEKAIRDTVRQFVREQVVPVRRRLVRAGHPPSRGHLGAREARALRHAPRRLRPSGRERGRLRPHLPRARGRRLGNPQRRLRAGVARDVRDLEVGLGGAEGALASGDAHRRRDRLLRPDRARCRLRPRHDAHARAPRRLGLDPQRRQDVDHERLDRGHRDRLGAHRGRRDPRLHRREGNARVHGTRDPQEALAARLGHLRARPRRRARSGRQHASRRIDPQGAALVPQRGAVRDRLRRGRRRARVLRGGARLLEGADRLRQADLGLPADAAEARGDGARDQPRHPDWRSTSGA